MVTGGFKTRRQAECALTDGGADLIGLARALVLEPDLPNAWRAGADGPAFPRFADPPEGAVTAWYTQRLTALGEDRETDAIADARTALHEYEARDAGRVALWNARHGR